MMFHHFKFPKKLGGGILIHKEDNVRGQNR